VTSYWFTPMVRSGSGKTLATSIWAFAMSMLARAARRSGLAANTWRRYSPNSKPGAAPLACLRLPLGDKQQQAHLVWNSASICARCWRANPEFSGLRVRAHHANAPDHVPSFPRPGSLTIGVNQYDVTRRGNPSMAGASLEVPIDSAQAPFTCWQLAQIRPGAAGCESTEDALPHRCWPAPTPLSSALRPLGVLQKQTALSHLHV